MFAKIRSHHPQMDADQSYFEAEVNEQTIHIVPERNQPFPRDKEDIKLLLGGTVCVKIIGFAHQQNPIRKTGTPIAYFELLRGNPIVVD